MNGMTDGTCSMKTGQTDMMNSKEDIMWIDTRDCEPMNDGVYLVQMAGGYLAGLEYTTDGGWNTSRRGDGSLSKDSAMSYKRVARWFLAPMPPKVPDEWTKEWLEEV